MPRLSQRLFPYAQSKEMKHSSAYIMQQNTTHVRLLKYAMIEALLQRLLRDDTSSADRDYQSNSLCLCAAQSHQA